MKGFELEAVRALVERFPDFEDLMIKFRMHDDDYWGSLSGGL